MARRTGKSQHRAAGAPAHPQRPQGFRLPPGVSHHREPVAGGGMAYVFRHEELGLLGRLVLQTFANNNTHVSMELAGDPADPMTARRAAIFKPLAAELTRRLDAQGGSMDVPPGAVLPASPPPSSHELVESKLMQCERCGTGVALLIFAPGATDLGRFEDYARKMYAQVKQLNVPTWVIGPALGTGPLMERPADMLKIWPEREAMQRLRPDEFNPMIEELAKAHCR